MEKLRIGFLSTARIGRRCWKAIFHSGNCAVTAVASRDAARSAGFVRDCQREFPFEKIPEALGCYEALLASKDVDAVYIPLPTGLRKEWVLRTAAARKHVICEKPCAVNAADLEEMISACKRNRVQFMDGVAFMHNQRLARVRKVLDDGQSVAPVRRISSAFSFYFGEDFFRDNIRVDGRLEPAGCLGDLGWYCLRFSLWAMNWQLPHTVSGRIHAQSAAALDRVPTPTEFSGELIFTGGISAAFYCSFLAQDQQWAFVSGQKGWLWLPDFVRPYDTYEPAFEVSRSEIRVLEPGGAKCPPGVDAMVSGHSMAQDSRLFRNFADQVFSDKLNDDWPAWSLKTQQVMDSCFRAARDGSCLKIEA